MVMTAWLRWMSPGGIGFLAGWMWNVELSVSNPKVFTCSHQLLPLEAAIFFLLVMVSARLGAFIGIRLVSLVGWSLFWLSLIAATVIVSVSHFLLSIELRAAERHAFKEIKDLAQKQMDYGQRHPDTGFACHFSELSVDASVSESSKGVESYYSGGYSHRLICYKDDKGYVNNFALWLTPFCAHTCGDVQYCASADGVIRAQQINSPNRVWRNCWTEGSPVASVLRK